MTRSLKQKPGKIAQPHPENPWLEALKTIVTAIILALGIRHFVAEARYIPSSSMEPTLEINDRLIIEKISYHLREPQRGDVVVFNTNDIPLLEKEYTDAFIKRVIGLPGEKIKFTNGRVYVNDQPLSEDYLKEMPNYECQKYNCGPIVVPDDTYLVLGDNRNNSLDSRFWGFVPKDNLIGRASVRFWPIDRVGNIDPNLPYQVQPQ